MKTAIYVRVSKSDQNPETQNVLLREYCEKNNLEIFDIYEDKCTGKSDSRPAFDELMRDMRDKRFNTIIVYKLDRIGRSLQHLLQLFQEFKNKHIDFISITQNINTTTPEGKLMLRMLMITDKEGKKHKTLGRPKGSKDSRPRPKSGYYYAWAKKREKAV
jgi:DNA invertase Pin-like site-specific DNA recombinase